VVSGFFDELVSSKGDVRKDIGSHLKFKVIVVGR